MINKFIKRFLSRKYNTLRGFTLVELLIYSVVFVVVSGILTGTLLTISRMQARENAAFEVSRQLQFVTQRIQSMIRSASTINNIYESHSESVPCTATSTYCAIRLTFAEESLNPTIISSDAGGIYIQSGLEPRVALTSPDIQVSFLRFLSNNPPPNVAIVNIDLSLVINPNDPQIRIQQNLILSIARAISFILDNRLLSNWSYILSKT